MKTKKLIRKIFKTYDYSLFKKLKGNRDIVESSLKGITKSMEEDGYSHNLVQVNEKMEIVDGQHPPIFRYVLAKKINIETFIILDDILNFIPRFNEELQDTIVWPDYFKMCMKYKPFFNHNLNNSKDTLKKVLEIQ